MDRIIRKASATIGDSNIIKIKQGDRVQRTGVLTLQEEIRLMERTGRIISTSIDKNIKVLEEETVRVKKFKEAFDLVDEKRKLDKLIAKNKKEIDKIKAENNEIIAEAQRMINTEGKVEETVKKE